MKKLTTLLIAAAFSSPVLATDAVDFGIGIENGYQATAGGYATHTQDTRPDGAVFAADHVVDFGAGIDEGWGQQREYRAGEVLLSGDGGSNDSPLDFGIGIEAGYKDCVC